LVDDGQCFDTSELYAVSTRLHSHGDARMTLVKVVTGKPRKLLPG
jgi:hypothetical protein